MENVRQRFIEVLQDAGLDNETIEYYAFNENFNELIMQVFTEAIEDLDIDDLDIEWYLERIDDGEFKLVSKKTEDLLYALISDIALVEYLEHNLSYDILRDIINNLLDRNNVLYGKNYIFIF